MSFMAAEIDESPAIVRQLVTNANPVPDITRQLGDRDFFMVSICGRGSSSHVGVFLRYLIESRLGIPVASAAPSVSTVYKSPLALKGTLFVVISQSGQSPDLVATCEAAKASSAATLAIVNAPDSPVANAADHVIAIGAGLERSVAATKTVIASMAACVRLVSDAANGAGIGQPLSVLPDRLDKAKDLVWQEWANAITRSKTSYVISRGYGLAAAKEIALKMSETLQRPALAYSAAEFQHGPRAAAGADTPILALRLNDDTRASVDEVIANLRKDGQNAYVCGGTECSLPWIGDADAIIDAITMLVPAYKAIERTAAHLGLDPDRPPHLSKVTETL